MAIMLTPLTCKISKISNLVFGGALSTYRARLLRSANALFSMTYNIFKKLNVFLSRVGAVSIRRCRRVCNSVKPISETVHSLSSCLTFASLSY